MSTQQQQGQELEVAQQGNELANRRLEGGLAEGNGVIDPARWQMLAAIAETVYDTAFVPPGLRGSKPSTLACLLYGDSLTLHPMVSLKEIHVIDGTPGLSAAAMTAIVRKAKNVLGEPAGHKITRKELRTGEGRFLGVTAHGVRGDDGTEDEYTFTLEMAARAGLMNKHNWKSYPEAMCSARAFSQLCTFLFSDVFMGSPLMPEELEPAETEELVGNAETGSPVVPIPAAATPPDEPPPAPKPMADPDGAERAVETLQQGEQTEWEVVLEGDGASVAYIDADDRNSIAKSGASFVKFPDVDGRFEVVGYEVDGATGKEKLIVRAEQPAAGQPAAGSPEAVVKENIPEILGKYVAEARARYDVEFIKGVLAAEKAGKGRARLIGTLEETIAAMESAAVAVAVAGDGTGDDNPLLDEEELLEGEHEPPAGDEEPLVAEEGEVSFLPQAEPEPEPEPEAEGDVTLAEVDPEIPYTSATRGAKLVRLAAFCAFMEDQQPTARAWHHSGVIGAAARQFGGTIHALEDLTDEQLELIWKAAEEHAPDGVKFLALMKPTDVVLMAQKAHR